MRDIRSRAGMIPLLGALWLSFSCKAKLPRQLAADAGGDFPCTRYADLLVAYTPAGQEGGSDLGKKALGPPDGEGVPVTTDTVLTIAFVGLGSLVDDQGGADDVQVQGSVDASSEVAVYVAEAGGDFVYSGALTQERMNISFSVSRARSVSSIQLVGIAGQASIDSFESLQTRCGVAAHEAPQEAALTSCSHLVTTTKPSPLTD